MKSENLLKIPQSPDSLDGLVKWSQDLQNYLESLEFVVSKVVYGDLSSHRMAATIDHPDLSVLDNKIKAFESGAQGDVLIRDATQWKKLAAGTSGYFLNTQGGGADAVWASGLKRLAVWDGVASVINLPSNYHIFVLRGYGVLSGHTADSFIGIQINQDETVADYKDCLNLWNNAGSAGCDNNGARAHLDVLVAPTTQDHHFNFAFCIRQVVSAENYTVYHSQCGYYDSGTPTYGFQNAGGVWTKEAPLNSIKINLTSGSLAYQRFELHGAAN